MPVATIPHDLRAGPVGRGDKELPDPTTRIVVYCQLGKISTLAAATLRTMGYARAVALDGGVDAWIRAGHPVEPVVTP